MRSVLLGCLHEGGETIRGGFFTIFGDMQVNISGGVVICMAKPVHDLMQWDAGLGQQGCVCMPEHMRCDVQRKLDDILDPVDAELDGFLFFRIAGILDGSEYEIMVIVPLDAMPHFFEVLFMPVFDQRIDNDLVDIQHTV